MKNSIISTNPTNPNIVSKLPVILSKDSYPPSAIVPIRTNPPPIIAKPEDKEDDFCNFCGCCCCCSLFYLFVN